MLVDTGAESSSLRPKVAERIGARAEYRVEQVSVAGSALTPAGPVAVRVGAAEDAGVEMLFSEIRYRRADGILGQNWLSRHSYLLDFEKGRLVLDGEPPATGVRLDYRESDGRPALKAIVNGAEEELVVDSGADVLVLFRQLVRPSERVELATNVGAIEARLDSALVEIDGGFRRRIQSAQVVGTRRAGLLPASVFRAIYIAKSKGLLVLTPTVP